MERDEDILCKNCGEPQGKHIVKNHMKDIMCPNPTTKNQRFKEEDE